MTAKNEKSKNLIPAIGLALILLVAFITFLRPTLNKNKLEKNDSENVTNAPERAAAKMTATELFKKISAQESIIILDIRPIEEFNKEHLKNSKNITANAVLNYIEKNKFYILVDSGATGEARNLAANFKDASYSNIFYLEGGFQNWKKGNFPTISEGDPESIIDQSKVSYITADDLKKIIDVEKNLLIIDLRNSDIYSHEHLKNSINIPIADIETKKNEINFSKKIILYADNELLAFKGAVKLFDLNIFNAFALSGGLDEWKKKGFEIVK